MKTLQKQPALHSHGLSTRDTKGSHLSTRHVPVPTTRPTEESPVAQLVETMRNLYEIVGVAEDCEYEELRSAFKKRALKEHPDKGGDQDRFDELKLAFNILEDDEKRDEYDTELGKARERLIVLGVPTRRKTEAEMVKVIKTAPHVGSMRAKDWLRCAAEHDIERSGRALVNDIRLAIVDAETASIGAPVAKKDPKEVIKEQTEALFQKFQGLNPGMKKQWLTTLDGKQKQALKTRAKEEEQKAMEKQKKWLAK